MQRCEITTKKIIFSKYSRLRNRHRAGINIGTGTFGQKNKRMAWNNHMAWKIWQKFEIFLMKKLKKKNIF